MSQGIVCGLVLWTISTHCKQQNSHSLHVQGWFSESLNLGAQRILAPRRTTLPRAKGLYVACPTDDPQTLHTSEFPFTKFRFMPWDSVNLELWGSAPRRTTLPIAKGLYVACPMEDPQTLHTLEFPFTKFRVMPWGSVNPEPWGSAPGRTTLP